MRHLNAMTAEGLDSKSDIAAELAHRDIQLAALEDAMRKVKTNAFSYFENDSMRPSAFVRLIQEIAEAALTANKGS